MAVGSQLLRRCHTQWPPQRPAPPLSSLVTSPEHRLVTSPIHKKAKRKKTKEEINCLGDPE